MRLDYGEIKERLKRLRGWVLAEGKTERIEKTFEFKNFVEAVSFVNSIVPLAEEANHHPDITINYRKVKLALTTHSEGGITEKDFDLAEKIETIV